MRPCGNNYDSQTEESIHKGQNLGQTDKQTYRHKHGGVFIVVSAIKYVDLFLSQGLRARKDKTIHKELNIFTLFSVQSNFNTQRLNDPFSIDHPNLVDF